MSNESWYTAKSIFLHPETECGPKQTYEERIVLLKADSFDAAIKLAEKEAKRHCRELADGTKFTGFVDVFSLFDEEIGKGTEIFSSMQRSELKPKEYLQHFYPAEPADCESIGETHRFYNLDGTHCACYHCEVIREDQL